MLKSDEEKCQKLRVRFQHAKTYQLLSCLLLLRTAKMCFFYSNELVCPIVSGNQAENLKPQKTISFFERMKEEKLSSFAKNSQLPSPHTIDYSHNTYVRTESEK